MTSYWLVDAPSTMTRAPLVYELCSVHRKAMVEAISAGLRRGPVGIRASSGSMISGAGWAMAVMGVSIMPGRTALTRMLRGAHLTARLWVRLTIPALAAP